ncbi:MAG: hypothetical protein CL916_07355 [Deltaproteobacteria bacterium]|nr:hypothetical protein [Deltaproteobacteria bacterium]
MWTLFFVLGACSSSIPVGDTQNPDVILVSIDTLRADHLSCYGYERRTSPFLDRLAEQGTMFSDARSPTPWTLPTHTTMMTGLHPHSHGVVDDSVQRDPNTTMLAQVMKESGYETAGVVSSLYVSSIFGFEKGFDFFEDFSLHTERANLSGRVPASDVVDRAIEWWKEREAGKPVFLFLHFYDAHYAYEPPDPYNRIFDRPSQKGDLRYRNYFHFQKNPPSKTDFRHLIAQYDESIRYIDDQLLRLHKELKGRSIRWVITSDHGEEFGERGSWGHAHTLYHEQLHVPLIISGANIPIQKVEQRVGTQDIMPTIASWCDEGEEQATDGINILGGEIPDRVFVAETSRFRSFRLSVAAQNYRLEWDLRSRSLELFSDRDFLETEDLSDQKNDLVTRLQSTLLSKIGKRWEARSKGVVKGKYIWDGTKMLSGAADIQIGDSFTVFPFDLPFSFQNLKETSVFSHGQRPHINSALVYLGEGIVHPKKLSPNVEQQLQQLGYIQED